MFDREIENIVNISKLRSIGYEQTIKVNNIINLNLPKSIKNLFLLESEGLLYQEKIIKVDSNRFDYSSPEVKKSIESIENALKENCIFNRNEYISILEKSVRLIFNYLTRPRWTLSRFVFKDEKLKKKNEISSLFRYFVDYNYYSEIILGYLENKSIQELSKDDFEKLLGKVDDAVLKRFTRNEIALMPKPLFDFVSYGDKHTQNKINIDLLVIFYKDKNLFGVSTAFELEKNVRGKNNLTLDELSRIIGNLDNIRTSEQPGISKLNNSKFNDSEQGNSEKEFGKSYRLISEINDTMEYDDSIFEGEKNDFNIDDLEKETKAESNKYDSFEESFEIIKKERSINYSEIKHQVENSDHVFIVPTIEKVTSFDDESARVENKSPVSFEDNHTSLNERNQGQLVEMNITESEGKTFIKKIFNKDDSKFKKALFELARLKSWKEAAVHIDRIFVDNDINPYSNPAIEFTNKIQIAFLTRKENVH